VNAEINPYVADPEWRAVIVWYFFLGGIAAGAYVTAVLTDLFGRAEDRRAVRIAYYLAFPLVSVCGLLLIADLGRPERFWHMMLQSNTGRLMLKWWSPMSIGSWGLAGFGFFSSLSFAGVLAEDGWLGLKRFSPLAARLRMGLTGRLFALGGSVSAFFLGSYTGVLLGASNQPLWSNTTWLGALFLASAMSTGVAAITLIGHWRKLEISPAAIERLERLDAWAILLEIILIGLMALSLGRIALAAAGKWPGALLPVFVIPVGLMAPLALRRLHGARASTLACCLVLIGGFALRAAIVGSPVPMLLGHIH
jgi:formate-dependent nitrite reductase membrane component NrfD